MNPAEMRGWFGRSIGGSLARRSAGSLIDQVRDEALRRLTRAITHVETSEAIAALTFDDGPHPWYTPRLLDLLTKYEIRATFFMLGEAARQYPWLVRQVAAAGHAIGNHSWDHTIWPRLSSSQRRWQLRTTQRALAPFGARLFRPPYGKLSLASSIEALMLGFSIVTWNVDVKDWRDVPDQVATRLRYDIRPGSIVLLHEVPYGSDQSGAVQERWEARLEALGRSLAELRQRYHLLTLPELFVDGRPIHQAWAE